jgi:hypothetical protein
MQNNASMPSADDLVVALQRTENAGRTYRIPVGDVVVSLEDTDRC